MHMGASGTSHASGTIRWLLCLWHALKCFHPDGKCPESNCSTAKVLLTHMKSCRDGDKCENPRCYGTKNLLHHLSNCRDQTCPVCPLVKKSVDQKEKKVVEAKSDIVAPPAETSTGTKSGKTNGHLVSSMIQLFTAKEVEDHIARLKVGQSKTKEEITRDMCSLCAAKEIALKPPPIYCTPCNKEIKRGAVYYTAKVCGKRHCVCSHCHRSLHRGDSINVDGTDVLKEQMQKKENDEETNELWVQCDECNAWQHEICALFNARRNVGGKAEYICPQCYLDKVKRKIRSPLQESAVLGAKDLLRTELSEHIETRLHEKLGDKVTGLVVRVVSSVDKNLEVNERFREIFVEEKFPEKFVYKSKAVLLFHKIEGVDVCIFAMYVHEFGAGCEQPNNRRVYLSYLDSLNYLSPGSFRKSVYHQILIGYLEYCKKRGFTSCYIWACPPENGVDYIFYCHPPGQKTLDEKKLRNWYSAMLNKARDEGIVVEHTNLYDHFFVTPVDCKVKETAARLPYFDGDLLPGLALDIIGGNKFTDDALMKKLGERIKHKKENLIMVHLQPVCTHCRLPTVSGTDRVHCNVCENFQLCARCYEEEQKCEKRDKHKHPLSPVQMNDVLMDTKDDTNIQSEIFDTRDAFLSLCRGNHYQYNTLRHAKHTSMMVLYHLHNPTAPVLKATCNECHDDIELGKGWHCATCSCYYDVCDTCYDVAERHDHVLTKHPSVAEQAAQTSEAKQLRVVQRRKMLELLVHASQCRIQCDNQDCRKVKELFGHGMVCPAGVSGDCSHCKKMWHLLQFHARACQEPECRVPRCRELNGPLRRMKQLSEIHRREGFMDKMRYLHVAEIARRT